MRGKINAGVIEAFCLKGDQQHVEALHGIDPGLIIV